MLPHRIPCNVETFLQHSRHAFYLQTVTNFETVYASSDTSVYSTLFTTLSSVYLNALKRRLLVSKSCCSEIENFEICKRFRVLNVCRFLVTRHGHSAWALPTESEEQPGRKGESKEVSMKDMHTPPRVQTRLLFTVYVQSSFTVRPGSCEEYNRHQIRYQYWEWRSKKLWNMW
jgi:hypothetical protein